MEALTSPRIPTRPTAPQKPNLKPTSAEKPKTESLDRTNLSNEANNEQTPTVALPRFDKIFDAKPVLATPAAPPVPDAKPNTLVDAQRLALQLRVTTGQTALATGIKTNPALRTFGGIGGVLGGTGLVTQGLQRGGLDGAAQIGSGVAHGIHGTAQLRDLVNPKAAPLAVPNSANPAGLLRKGVQVAGRVAPILGGGVQVYDGIKTGDRFDQVSGGAKIAGGALLFTPLAPIGAGLVAASTVADVGRFAYNRSETVRNIVDHPATQFAYRNAWNATPLGPAAAILRYLER